MFRPEKYSVITGSPGLSSMEKAVASSSSPAMRNAAPGGFLLFGDERAALEPRPQGGNGVSLAHKCPIPPQKVVTARAP